MNNLNESTIEWNDEQFWIKFAYHEQLGLLLKRPNVSIINTNETGSEQIDESGKIKLIDITFLVLVICTIVFVFVTLTVKVLCQRLNDKDFDIEYLETLSRNIAASRAFSAVHFGQPASKFVSKSINKSINKSIKKSFLKSASESASLPSHKTGPMSVPVQSSSFSIQTSPIDQDKSSSDLRLNVSTVKGKISSIPSKQSVILPVNESKYASKAATDKVPSSSQSFPDAAPLSKQSLDLHSGYRLSSSSFDNLSGESPRNLSLSLGFSREDFISVLSDRDSFEMDTKSLHQSLKSLRSKKSQITSGLLQNSKTSKQADSNSNISHSSLKDNLNRSSYQIEKIKTLSVNKPTRVKVSNIYQDSYPFGSRISKSPKTPKSQREIQSRALSGLESKGSRSVGLKTHKPRALPPRGSWKSTKTIEKNVKHNSPKHAN